MCGADVLTASAAIHKGGRTAQNWERFAELSRRLVFGSFVADTANTYVLAFEDIKPGARLRGLDAAWIAEIVQVARYGADAFEPGVQVERPRGRTLAVPRR